MILRIVVSPNAVWSDVSFACSTLGVPCAFFKQHVSEAREPSGHMYLGPLRVMYVEDVSALKRQHVLKALEENTRFMYVVIIGCVPDRFARCVVYHGPVVDLVRYSMDLIDDESPAISFREPNHQAKLLNEFQRDSILSRVSQLLYRIKDKTERAQVGQNAYRFLAGYWKRPPSNSGINKLQEVLKSDLAKRYNEAGQRVLAGEDIDTVCELSNLDRFDVAYCIRKSTSDPRVLARIAFKE